MKLKDKVVVVTASTRGIGLAVSEACAREGARVYMAARNLALAEREASRLSREGGRVSFVYHDATEPETYAAMAEQVAHDAGRIDVLVNNFGTSDPRRDLDFANTDVEVFLDTVTKNLRSVFLASQSVLRYMRQGGGSIVNISSVGGSVPDVSQTAYGTSKAAINYLTRLIAVHEAANGIRCNAVLPGMIRTDRWEKNPDFYRDVPSRFTPIGDVADGADIADAVWYFAEHARNTTGAELVVDGGNTVQLYPIIPKE